MGAKEEYLGVLQEELVMVDRMRRSWIDLEKKHAELKDKDEHTIATAKEMVEKYVAREKELRAHIQQIKVL